MYLFKLVDLYWLSTSDQTQDLRNHRLEGKPGEGTRENLFSRLAGLPPTSKVTPPTSVNALTCNTFHTKVLVLKQQN